MTLLDDPNFQAGIGLLCCGAGVTLIALQRRRREPRLQERLTRSDVAQSEPGSDILREQGLTLPPRLLGIAQAVASVGEGMAGSPADKYKLRELLTLAGLRQREALGLLMAGKYLLGLTLASLVLLLGFDAGQRLSLNGLTAALMALFFGTLIPELWLKWRSARRGGLLARSLPDALDLMVICAEAGLPLGRILQVVAKEMTLSAPEMAEELRYTCAELQLVSDRSRALQHLADRTGVSGIESMVSTLIQAERYGTPLSQALRTISDESRKTMILTLEERAGKLPAQLSVPLMTLILPPIIAMMGAPALVRIVRLLSQ